MAASCGAAAATAPQSVSGIDRIIHGLRGTGGGACPRWNMTASKPNSGVVRLLGARPCLAVTAPRNASLPVTYSSEVTVSGDRPVITQIWASFDHILSTSKSVNPRLAASCRNVAADSGSLAAM